MWTYLHWACVTRISGNFPAKKMLFDITRIRWKSPNLKTLSMMYKNFVKTWHISLTLSWQRTLSCRNQSINLHSKSMDWSIYDKDLRHERVNLKHWHIIYVQITTQQLMFSTKSNLICWAKFFFLKSSFLIYVNKRQSLVCILMSFSFASFLKHFLSSFE